MLCSQYIVFNNIKCKCKYTALNLEIIKILRIYAKTTIKYHPKRKRLKNLRIKQLMFLKWMLIYSLGIILIWILLLLLLELIKMTVEYVHKRKNVDWRGYERKNKWVSKMSGLMITKCTMIKINFPIKINKMIRQVETILYHKKLTLVKLMTNLYTRTNPI